MAKEIYLAGGCYWGVQHYLDGLKGVKETTVGFANGRKDLPDPTYEQVRGGDTGYTETVKVVYDPSVLPLRALLRLFYQIIDPTLVDRQGADVGHNYRTGVYAADEFDLPDIYASLIELQNQTQGKVAVEWGMLQNFYPAGEAHQKYLEKNPAGYCHVPVGKMQWIRTVDPKDYSDPFGAGLRSSSAIFLGSSVTYGAASGGIAFPEFLCMNDGLITIKEAVSGTTLVDNGPDSYIARMKKIYREFPADVFVCQLSTNDATRKLPLADIRSALETILAFARDTFHCPVVFYTNPRFDSKEYAAMVDCLTQLVEEANKDGSGLPVYILDFWNNEVFSKLSQQTLKAWMADPIHPTMAGYQGWWTPVFGAFLEGVVKKGASK